MPRPIRTVAASIRAGFTLIELLAVIMIIGILATFLLPKIPEAIDNAEVTACSSNMGSVYQGFLIYKTKFKHAPKESGVRFFADLIRTKTWENSKSSVQKLTCPGVDRATLAVGDLPEEEWFADFESIDGSYSTYAGRNCEEFPLRKFPHKGSIALMADDNDGGMNHRTTTNSLMADGSVVGYELATLLLEGILLEGEEILLVGPDSPVEGLQELSLD